MDTIITYNCLFCEYKTKNNGELMKHYEETKNCRELFYLFSSKREPDFQEEPKKPFKVNAYKDTDYSYVPYFIDQYVDDNNKLKIDELIRVLHFNPDHPENHNMYIADKENKTLMLYDGEEFIATKTGEDTFDFLVEDICTKFDKRMSKYFDD